MNKDSLVSNIKKSLLPFEEFRYESVTIGSQVDDPSPKDPVVVEISYRGSKSIDPRVFDKIEGRLRSNLPIEKFSVTSRDKECELWMYFEENTMKNLINDQLE